MQLPSQEVQKYTIQEAQLELKAELLSPQRDDRDNYCVLWSGEGGIGKSSAIAQVAAEAGCRFRSWHHGATIEEDNHGVQFRDGDTTRWAVPEHLADLVDGKLDPGILFIDEIFSGQTIGHQNFVRMLIDRKFHGRTISPGWLIVGATNPETGDYLSVRAVDKALQDRMLVYHVEPSIEELLEYWDGKMPEKIFTFLMLNNFDGKIGYLRALSPRNWMKLARAIERRMNSGVPADQIYKLMSINGSVELAGAFRVFLDRGANPDAFPLAFETILTKSKWLDRLAGWIANKRNALVAASNWNVAIGLRKRVASSAPPLTMEQMKSVAEFLFALGNNGFAEMAYNTMMGLRGSPYLGMLLDIMKGTALFEKINALMKETDPNTGAVRK